MMNFLRAAPWWWIISQAFFLSMVVYLLVSLLNDFNGYVLLFAVFILALSTLTIAVEARRWNRRSRC